MLNHAQKHRRLRVCKSCQNLGFSPKDVSMYKCKNGCKYGHLQFKAANLANHKRRGDPLECLVCCEEKEKQDKKDKERAKRIQKALQEKGAWKCTCKCPIHAPKCQLYPSYAGERRWQGKNKGVSEEDLQFIAKRIRK